MALNAAGIATAVAALSVSGVTIKDLTAIPQAVGQRDCPILYPSPDNWMGSTTAALKTFGTANSRYWEAQRNLNYVYLHAAVGSERNLAVYMQAMAQKVDAIFTAFLTLGLANTDVRGFGNGPYGVLADAAGNQFYGCLLSLAVWEQVNP